MFSCKFCEISKNAFFSKNTSGGCFWRITFEWSQRKSSCLLTFSICLLKLYNFTFTVASTHYHTSCSLTFRLWSHLLLIKKTWIRISLKYLGKFYRFTYTFPIWYCKLIPRTWTITRNYDILFEKGRENVDQEKALY